jgi:hypothetical protein
MSGDDILYLALALAILVPLALDHRIRERAARTDSSSWGIAVVLVALLAFAAPFIVQAMVNAYQQANQPPPQPVWSPYDDPSYDPYGTRSQATWP